MKRISYQISCLALLLAALAVAEKKPIQHLIVKAVSHDRRVNEYTSAYTTPGTSNTNCSGSATTLGNTTLGNANCQTTSTPAQVHQQTRYTVDVTDWVEAEGRVYTITCRANWVGSNCASMIDGDQFEAEIEGSTMWITAHKGGNQGKEVRTKYRILDIRAYQSSVTAISQPVTSAPSQGGPISSTLRNADIIALRQAGLSDQVVLEKIGSSANEFSLGTTDLVALKKAGVSDAVISAMLAASRR